MSCPTNAVSHDGWPEREKAFMENLPELALELQEHLKYLSESLSETLQPALALEQRFGERNNKTMYLAPFIRSVIHAAATGIDIQHISLYPLPVDPCVTCDPLLRKIRVPRYGIVTGIICASIPFPIDFPEPSDDASSARDETADEEEEEQSSIDFRDYIAGKGMEEFAPTYGYATCSRSAVLDHSFLARLTIDLVEERTPLGLLCIAQAQDIHSAMTSCLFQRLAWGIREPLVGISLDDTTSIVQVLIGWLEDSDKFDCFVIHVAQDESGSYDLSDASQALNFALVLANVGQRFLTICTTALTFTEQLKLNISEGRLKHWRMDQTGLTPCVVPEEEPSLFEKMLSWLNGVEPLPVALSEDIKVEHSQPFPSSTTMPPKPPSSTNLPPRSDGYHTRSRGPLVVHVTGPEAQPDEGNEDATDGNTIPAQDERASLRPALTERQSSGLSASKLAAGGGETDAGRPTRFWLLSRLATTRTFYYHGMLNTPKPSKHTTQDALYRKICLQYHDLLSFAWLDTDTHPLDVDLKALAIVKNAESAVPGAKSLEMVGQFAPYKPLSSECDKILRENLLVLSSIFMDIQRLMATGSNASELDCRTSLDHLLLRIFQGKVDGTAEELENADYQQTHVMASLKRSVMLPRAYVTELSSSLDESEYIDLIDVVEKELRGPLLEDNEAVRILDTTVSTTTFPPSEPSAQVPNPSALTASKIFKDDSKTLKIIANAASSLSQTTILAARESQDIPQQYHEWEPVKAVCDSVGYIRIPGVFSSITASESFNVIHPPAMKSKSKSTSDEASNHPTPTGSKDIQGTTTSRLLKPQIGRPVDVKNSEDISATSQNFAFSLAAADALPKKTSAPSPAAGDAPRL